jgi:hypothetical protein
MFNMGEFAESEKQAALWFADQPTEVRAALAASYLNIIQLKQYNRAVVIAERGVKLHGADWSMRNCAMLASAYAGNLQRAKEHLAVLSKEDSDEEVAIFSEAGQGFISFCENRVDAGRQQYEHAIRRARRQGRSNLVLTGAIYWLERESVAGTMERLDIEKLVALIESSIPKLSSAQAKEIKATFDARKEVILDVDRNRSNEGGQVLLPAEHITRALEYV